jgi:hypothetical protein
MSTNRSKEPFLFVFFHVRRRPPLSHTLAALVNRIRPKTAPQARQTRPAN